MFKKASKKQSKLRCAIFGVSGSGKTYSALRIASGMGGKIALIDTERGSASKYAGSFDFDVAELTDHSIDGYIKMINGAKGYNVLIIDSLTHAWQELLEQIDLLAKSKYKGNTWSAWSDGTPKQKMLVNALLAFDGHIISTMRSKTEWTMTTNSNGKNTPTRVGLTPEQGKGIEYEFDLLIEISEEHHANIIKDRTGKFQDKIISKPGEELGKQLIDWLSDGEEVIAKKVVAKEKIGLQEIHYKVIHESLENIYMSSPEKGSEIYNSIKKRIEESPILTNEAIDEGLKILDEAYLDVSAYINTPGRSCYNRKDNSLKEIIETTDIIDREKLKNIPDVMSSDEIPDNIYE